MEQLGIWSARIELLGEHTAAIEKLSNDSDKHRLVLEKWLNKLHIDIPENVPRGMPVKSFDFSGMAPPDMFAETMKYEVLTKDIYEGIRDADPKLIQEILPDSSDAHEFISDFEMLVTEESMHAKLCNKMVGGFGSIRVVHV